jgi:hypothetical protein
VSGQPCDKQPRCVVCGKFVNCADKSARFNFVPDNHFGPEQSEWVHRACDAPLTKEPT